VIRALLRKCFEECADFIISECDAALSTEESEGKSIGFRWNISDNERGESSRIHKSQIRYTTKGSPYFICNRRRVYLDECIKIK
jgi:hypothetical protein